MKKIAGLTLASSMFFFVNLAYGANLSLSPGEMTVTVAQGQSGTTSTVASLSNVPQPVYSFIFGLSPAGGNLPPSWISMSPTSLSHSARFVKADINVRVPAGIPPGLYTLLLRPYVFYTTVQFTPPSQPFSLTLTVPAAACSAVPSISISSFGPTEFKIPNNKLASVELAGSVSLPGGCALKRVWYQLSDEYGEYGQAGELSGASGSFSTSVPVMVSRRGDDKDGRRYELTVFAESEAGVGSSDVLTTIVGHDQRKK